MQRWNRNKGGHVLNYLLEGITWSFNTFWRWLCSKWDSSFVTKWMDKPQEFKNLQMQSEFTMGGSLQIIKSLKSSTKSKEIKLLWKLYDLIYVMGQLLLGTLRDSQNKRYLHLKRHFFMCLEKARLSLAKFHTTIYCSCYHTFKTRSL